jgi:hypothetical protein
MTDVTCLVSISAPATYVTLRLGKKDKLHPMKPIQEKVGKAPRGFDQ